MKLMLNFVAFQLGWFACVLGAANALPWLGPVVVATVVSLHLATSTGRFHSFQSPEEAAESKELQISQLFVAMTRARDLLVLLYDRDPSEVIVDCLDRFELAQAR